MSTYSFVGTPQTADKVGFTYGGRSPDFDPATYYEPIRKILDEGHVLDGIVGGYLPILRFVYPESAGKWTEMITFAPLRTVNTNDRIQSVWYRIVHVENGSVTWTRYIDSYHPFPPRTNYDPRLFYHDLVSLQAGWSKILAPAMKINVPDTPQRNSQSAGCPELQRIGRTNARGMNRPPLEVADIIRSAGASFWEKSKRWMTWQHHMLFRCARSIRPCTILSAKVAPPLPVTHLRQLMIEELQRITVRPESPAAIALFFQP